MIKRKGIILTFLFFSWTIIFAHSIVPHHHHEKDARVEHNHQHHHKHSHDTHDHHQHDCDLEDENFSDCSDNCNDHACHFHVDVLTKVSIDHVFILNNEKSLFGDIKYLETDRNSFYQEIISDADAETYYLRGPPSIA